MLIVVRSSKNIGHFLQVHKLLLQPAETNQTSTSTTSLLHLSFIHTHTAAGHSLGSAVAVCSIYHFTCMSFTLMLRSWLCLMACGHTLRLRQSFPYTTDSLSHVSCTLAG
ncbi:uncharacterized [Lates japonicus]